MPRPSFISPLALSLFALASLTGCKTIYSDTYSYKRNYFKPEKETARPSELLPESMPGDAAPPMPPVPEAPGLDPTAPAPPPADGMAPGAPPAIPGL